ncbi:MAG: threonine synthase [Rhodospirillales bacterium]|nr:threonine synthase [Rhodospirillales bacterium]
MKYISTRGGGDSKSFTDVLLAGLAPDGGLYLPDRWPLLDRAMLDHMAGLAYADIAYHVMRPYVGDSIDDAAFKAIIQDTYNDDVFGHAAIAPLVQIGPNAWVLELFHGPTLAFKDYALQLLGRLFDHVLAQEGRRITIVGATSGDTGSAAIEACKGRENIDIFILHPEGRTSDVQRKQMTTVDAPNVHNIAVKGTFDDCQAMVKDMFADEKMRAELNLSAVNSINWARIMAQVVYYVSSAVALGAARRPVSFAVPTGNFGNVFAAHIARKMGLPIHQLVIGSNRNDILTRFFETGAMTCEGVMPSLSPSMDIQVSSNFERYLFEALDRDPAALTSLMTKFKKEGSFALGDNLMTRVRGDFAARRCGEEDTLATMRECYRETGYLVDPHTAVGLHAAMAAQDDPSVPIVVAATAHPAKFPAAVKQAVGFEPAVPERLAAVKDKAERYTPLANDLDTIKAFIRKQSGA